MQDTDVPVKFPLPFGENAVSGTIRAVPVTTTDPNAASLDLGFPENTFTPIGAGGSPPNGEDFNGILNQETAWARWLSAGGPIKYDATFAADANVGGYPKGSIVQSAATFGLFFYCLTNDNVTDPDAGGAGWQAFNIFTVPATGGQFRNINGGTCGLFPYNGGYLWIDGLNYQIPAGLTVINSGLSFNTLYYCYAYMNAGVMTLEASLTGKTFAANGIPQKAGDPTRTLVGSMYTDPAGAFIDTQVKRNVNTWFNRRSRQLYGQFTNITIANTSPTLLSAVANVEAIVWDDEATLAVVTGTTTLGTSIDIAQTYVGLDGAQVSGGSSSALNASTISKQGAQAAYSGQVAEGHHVWTPFGNTQGGNNTNWAVNMSVLIGGS